MVDFFAKVCQGVDMQCVNVNKGYVETSPEVARELIKDSHLLVAIATRREQLKSGAFEMPKAVEQEISMAFGSDVPILIFVEDGVDTSGFTKNFSNYLRFGRESLKSPEFIEKVVSSIHGAKMNVILPEDLQIEQMGQKNVFAELCRNKIELVERSGTYIWRYLQTRRLKFTSRFVDPIRAAAWVDSAIKDIKTSEFIKWDCRFENGTKDFKLTPTPIKRTQKSCILSIDIEPKPEKDDIIQFSVEFESPYLNPVYLEDLQEDHPEVIICGIKYLCCDGHIPTIREKDMKTQFWFPASFGMKPNDFVPFVGSYTGKVDYLVESETERMAIVRESFGGDVLIETSIQSPLLQHIYGIAWNPPKKTGFLAVLCGWA